MRASLAAIVAILVCAASPAEALEQPGGAPIPSNMGCSSGQPTGLAPTFACICDTPGVCNSCGAPCNMSLGQCSWNCLYSTDSTQSYCTDPFLFQRATVLDILCSAQSPGAGNCPLPCTVPANADTSMAQNLYSVPVQTYYHCTDTFTLTTQNNELNTFMTGLTAPNYATIVGNSPTPDEFRGRSRPSPVGQSRTPGSARCRRSAPQSAAPSDDQTEADLR